MRVLLSLLWLLSTNGLSVGIIFAESTGTEAHIYRSYQNTIYCKPSQPIIYPESIPEIQNIVQTALKTNQTVKALGSLHSITDIICTDGIPIHLRNINHMILGENGKEAHFGAGVKLIHALQFLEKFNKTLITAPFYGGITIGGAIGTGAHGSSLRHPTSLSDLVISIQLVDGVGALRRVTDPGSLSALSLHLGLLGIVTEVTLGIVPLFKMRVANQIHPESDLHSGKLLKMGAHSDYYQLSWFPNSKEVVVTAGEYFQVNDSTPGNSSVHMITDVNPVLAVGLGWIYELFHAFRWKWGLDYLETGTKGWLTSPVLGSHPFYGENGVYTNPAVGIGWRLMSSYCQPGHCWWDNSWGTVNGLDSALAFDIKEFQPVMDLVSKTVEQNPVSFHQFGILIRFSPPSSAIMATSWGRRTFFVEWVMPQRKQAFIRTTQGLATLQFLLQTMVSKHGGRPHWGKNGLLFFNTANLIKTTLNRVRFLEVLQDYDPHSVFANKFKQRLLGTGDGMDVDPAATRCALHNSCSCSKDRDCAPRQKCGLLNGIPVCWDNGQELDFSKVVVVSIVLVVSKYLLF